MAAELLLSVASTGVQVGVLVLGLFLLRPVLRRRLSGRWRRLILLVLLVRLCLPLSMSLPAAPVHLQAPDAVLPVSAAPAPKPIEDSNLPAGRTPSPGVQAEAPQPPMPVVPSGGSRTGWRLKDLCAAIWLAGMGLAAAVLLVRHLHLLRRFRRWARRCGDTQILSETAAACSRLGIRRVPPVLVSGLAHSPMLCGAVHPRLLLPEGPALPDEELRLVLAHELTHLAHHDLLWKLLAACASVLHWFNPAVWLLAGMLSDEMELACDDAVAGTLTGAQRTRYAGLLLNTAAGGRQPLATTFHSPAGVLRARLRNLLDGRRRTGGVLLCALVLCAVVLTGSLVACSFAPAVPEPGSAQHREQLLEALRTSTEEALYRDFYGQFEDGGDYSLFAVTVAERAETPDGSLDPTQSSFTVWHCSASETQALGERHFGELSLLTAGDRQFLLYEEPYAAGSSSYLYGSRGGHAYSPAISGRVMALQADPDSPPGSGRLVGYHSSTDATELGGRTVKPYWFLFDGARDEFCEYGAVETELSRLRAQPGWEGALQQLEELCAPYGGLDAGLVNVLCRADSIYNFNLNFGGSNYCVTFRQDGPGAEPALSEGGDGQGVYLPAMLLDLAVYPEEPPEDTALLEEAKRLLLQAQEVTALFWSGEPGSPVQPAPHGGYPVEGFSSVEEVRRYAAETFSAGYCSHVLFESVWDREWFYELDGGLFYRSDVEYPEASVLTMQSDDAILRSVTGSSAIVECPTAKGPMQFYLVREAGGWRLDTYRTDTLYSNLFGRLPLSTR